MGLQCLLVRKMPYQIPEKQIGFLLRRNARVSWASGSRFVIQYSFCPTIYVLLIRLTDNLPMLIQMDFGKVSTQWVVSILIADGTP